ncbi:MAG: dimethyl sulfoxide reductase anchor subunit family protein, partial [Planctomycetaceae bacterium]
HPPWPLIVMLVLTQLSVGAFVVGLVLESLLDPDLLGAFRPLHATSALGFGLLALAASTLHLGRPRYAFRAVMGLRHSWLSREIVAFGAFAGLACLFAATSWMTTATWVFRGLGWMVAATGLAGLLCSVMIYVFTGREWWSLGRTTAKFLLTASVLGIACTWLSILGLGLFVDSPAARMLSEQAGTPLVQALVIAATFKLLLEASLFRHVLTRRQSPLKRSARLLLGPLSASTFARFACGLLGGIVMPLFLGNELAAGEGRGLFLLIAVAMLFAACLAGELLERYQFFAACASPRMPGGV